jgi:hypothetical protein
MFYHLSLTPSPFCFTYFRDRVSHFYLGWPRILLFMLPVLPE